MNEAFSMILTFIGGFVLGTLFFGGLWLTLKRLNTSTMPGLLFSVSFLIRAGITVSGFYYISLSQWQRLLIAVLGYVAARFVVLRLTKPLDEKQVQLVKGGHHEP